MWFIILFDIILGHVIVLDIIFGDVILSYVIILDVELTLWITSNIFKATVLSYSYLINFFVYFQAEHRIS